MVGSETSSAAAGVCCCMLQTYLEQNEGAGLQHLALKTNDIIRTMREMSSRSKCGGFEFMAPPSEDYYKRVAAKIVSARQAAQGLSRSFLHHLLPVGQLSRFH
jgi:4-hydroxyphenylpyruvate dioxygenase-like putative hemolysin